MKTNELEQRLSARDRELFADSVLWSSVPPERRRWPSLVASPSAAAAALQRMSDEAKAVLRTAVCRFGAGAADEERLIQAAAEAAGLAGSEARLGALELYGAGILFAVRKAWGDRMAFLPADVYGVWLRSLYPCRLVPLDADAERQALPVAGKSGSDVPLSRRLLEAWAAMFRSGAGLTAKSALPRRTAAAIEEKLAVAADDLAALGLKPSGSAVHSLPAALALDIGFRLGMIGFAPEAGCFEWRDEAANEWFALGHTEREKRLIGLCAVHYARNAAPLTQSAALLEALQPFRWYRVSDIHARLSELAAPLADRTEAASAIGGALDGWLNALSAFGWMERGCDGTGEPLVRWLWEPPGARDAAEDGAAGDAAADSCVGFGEGDAEEPLYIQPDGDLLAGPLVGYAVRWELEQIADKVSDELVNVYRLSAKSIGRAREEGRTEDGIRRFLERASGCPLPPAVDAALAEWAMRAGRVAFAEAVLLRCDTADIADALERDPALAPLFIERIGPLHFAVDREELAAIRKRLESLGFPLSARMTALGGDAGGDKQRAKDAGGRSGAAFPAQMRNGEGGDGFGGFIEEPRRLQLYELAVEHPQPHEWFPQLDKTPAMWLRQMRAYHPSTRREMVERALLWQTPLKLRTEAGAFAFIPGSLEGTGGTNWAVTGTLRGTENCSKVRLTPEMWNEMMLIVPGVSP